MKSLVNRVVAVLVLGALASVVSFAKEKKQSVTLPTNVKINGTQVKQGDYDLVFDEQTGELSIMKGKTVVAKSTARLEKRDKKAKSTEIRSSGSGGDIALVSITFGGSDQSIVLTGNSGSTTGSN
jgi:hypothetical protein